MRRSTLQKAIRLSRGFTLVELGVVVAIVGILAVIAIVGYRKMILSSKMTEAKTMVNAIRLAEEDYKAESGTYLDVAGGTYCPADTTVATNAGKKFTWEQSSCAGGKWAQLPVHSDGPVQFGYTVYAGTSVTQPGTVPTALMDLSLRAGEKVPYYVVHAKSDLDQQGGLYSEVASSSFSGHIYTLNEGE